jgi:PBP1b-binding outer membrane lipoprotein LpoB
MNLGRMPFQACGACVLALLLGACGTTTAPSAEENRQLDNAAEMLDAAPQSLENIDANALGPVDSNTAATDGSER